KGTAYEQGDSRTGRTLAPGRGSAAPAWLRTARGPERTARGGHAGRTRSGCGRAGDAERGCGAVRLLDSPHPQPGLAAVWQEGRTALPAWRPALQAWARP